MKKTLKIIFAVVAVLIFGVACLLTYVKVALPNVGPAPDLKVELTPERVERGKYLAHNVCACIDCHSTRDWSKLTGPLIEGTLGKGGEKFNQDYGFPGTYYSRNITPAGIGNWTDGEVFRAITSGMSKDGRPLFPVMPHPAYGKMDSLDIISIIAYLRTLKPIENNVPESSSDFPMNFIIHTIPAKPNFKPIPAKTDTLKYGEYLLSAGSCVDCHSPKDDKGQYIEGMKYAGGFNSTLTHLTT
ncbi:MAG: cytochrome C [Cytophagaceae bacterium]|nr:cytochrome C [Cytophagaceae bacterium]